MNGEQHKLVIIYATQTGQAKSIAETINDEALENGFETKMFDISKYDKEFKLNEITDPLIFVCSTTGDGEPPESAQRCYSRLKRLDTETHKSFLSNLNYALLGLGDTNYTQFCNGPKLFHNRFLELGANCFYGPRWADDGVGLELEVEPFKEGLWDALDQFFENKSKNSKESPEDKLCSEINRLTLHNETIGSDLTLPELIDNNLIIEYGSEMEQLKDVDLVKTFASLHQQSSNGIFKAKIEEAKLMSKNDSEKYCYHIKFTLEDSFNSDGSRKNDLTFLYEPGYSIDLITPNSKYEVDNLLKHLNLYEYKNKKVIIQSKDLSKKLGQSFVKLSESNLISLEFFLTYCVDLRTNVLKKNFLRMLASYCENEKDKLRLLQLCSKEGSEEYQNLIKENLLTVLDLLNIFKSCKPPLNHLIQMLPGLNTRSYSLCSIDSQTQMEFIFNLVKFKLENNRTYERNGIATDYLSKISKGENFYFMRRKFNNFTFPMDQDENINKPIIMIGPGTGIAPFISYLRYRESLNLDLSNLYLFYGCRDPEKDFLFKQELMDCYARKLKLFSISFSRFTYNPNDSSKEETDLVSFIEKYHLQNSKYVQDSIRYYSKDLINLIHNLNGFIYVCGDAKNMSKDVFNCFVECLIKELNLNQENASKYLMEMIKNKRYKQDIWA